jgi:hypothetical protein
MFVTMRILEFLAFGVGRLEFLLLGRRAEVEMSFEDAESYAPK